MRIRSVFKVVLVVLMLISIISPATASPSSVSINSADITLGESVTLPISIETKEEISCATVLLTYDNSIVSVQKVDRSDFDSFVSHVDNSNGRTKIVAYQTSEYGLKDDVKIADVTIEAIGVGSSPLNLEVETLKNNIGITVPRDVVDGSFEVRSPPPTTEEPKNITVPVRVQVENVTAEKGKVANTSIMIRGVEEKELSSANISLSYDPSVVDVESAGGSDFDDFVWSMPSKGCIRMVAYQTGAEGLKGDIKFAGIKLRAVGKANEGSDLTLDVKELRDNEGYPVPFEVKNGSLSIKGIEQKPSKPTPSLGVLGIISSAMGAYLIIKLRRDEGSEGNN